MRPNLFEISRKSDNTLNPFMHNVPKSSGTL